MTEATVGLLQFQVHLVYLFYSIDVLISRYIISENNFRAESCWKNHAQKAIALILSAMPRELREITEIGFRTMRDLMTDETVEHVAEELHTPIAENGGDTPLPRKTPLMSDVADLWEDTNPLVHLLSRVRPMLDVRDTTFLFRIQQEAGLPPHVEPERVVKAVFSVTKCL